MENSITVETTICNEANRLIAIFNANPQNLLPEMVEAPLESLHAIAEQLALPIAKTLKVRLIALRNNLKVSEVSA